MKRAVVLTEPNRPLLPELALREPSNSTEQSANLQRNFVPVPGAELSIVVPTFNERENVAELIRRLDQCLMSCSWEIIFVDDSRYATGLSRAIVGADLKDPMNGFFVIRREALQCRCQFASWLVRGEQERLIARKEFGLSFRPPAISRNGLIL